MNDYLQESLEQANGFSENELLDHYYEELCAQYEAFLAEGYEKGAAASSAVGLFAPKPPSLAFAQSPLVFLHTKKSRYTVGLSELERYRVQAKRIRAFLEKGRYSSQYQVQASENKLLVFSHYSLLCSLRKLEGN